MAIMKGKNATMTFSGHDNDLIDVTNVGDEHKIYVSVDADKLQTISDAVVEVSANLDEWQDAIKGLNSNWDELVKSGKEHKKYMNKYPGWWAIENEPISSIDTKVKYGTDIKGTPSLTSASSSFDYCKNAVAGDKWYIAGGAEPIMFSCEARIDICDEHNVIYYYRTQQVNFSKADTVVFHIASWEAKQSDHAIYMNPPFIVHHGVGRYFEVKQVSPSTTNANLILHVTDKVKGELYNFLTNGELAKPGANADDLKFSGLAFSNLFTKEPIATVPVTSNKLTDTKPNLFSISPIKRAQLISDAIEFPYEAPDAWYAGDNEQRADTPDYETVVARVLIGMLFEYDKLDKKLNDEQRKELVENIRSMIIDSEKAYIESLVDNHA